MSYIKDSHHERDKDHPKGALLAQSFPIVTG